jgi:hypothetical protein
MMPAVHVDAGHRGAGRGQPQRAAPAVPGSVGDEAGPDDDGTRPVQSQIDHALILSAATAINSISI